MDVKENDPFFVQAFGVTPVGSRLTRPSPMLPVQAFGVTVKCNVPMRVTSFASNPTKMSMR